LRHDRSQLRAATPDDLPSLASLVAGHWTPAMLAPVLEGEPPRVWVVAEPELVAMAAISVAADEAELQLIVVASAHRRLGFARALLLRVIEVAAARGATAMFLEVAETNEPAIELYRAHGFAPVGARRGYYPEGSDALVMRRPLATTQG